MTRLDGPARGATIVLAGHPVPKGAGFRPATTPLAAALAGEPGVGRVIEVDATDGSAIVRAIGQSRGARVVVPVLMNEGATFDIVRRAAHSGRRGRIRLCLPLGTARAVADIGLALALKTCREAGWRARDVTVVCVGHGAARDPRAQRSTLDHAARIRRPRVFRGVMAAFIEAEPSFAATLASVRGRTVVVAFFLGRGRHVVEDVGAVVGRAGANVRYAGSIGEDRALETIVRRKVRAALRRG
ncbi:MAG: CbiX/SirB N-terminal domain-containing protein [Alphaproteobacteria bacterium]